MISPVATEGLAIPELASDEERRVFFARHPELLRAEEVETLCAEVLRWIRVDPEQAIDRALTARWLADHIDDEGYRARSARALANAYHFCHRYDAAQALYAEALERHLALGEELEAAITRSSALLNIAYLGDYDQVFAWHDEARRVFEAHGDRLRLANLAHNLANIHYRQDRWQDALEHYRIAYDEFLALERSHHAAICLRNIAVCRISLHHFSEALRVYEQSRAYCAEHGLDRLVMEIDYNIAYLYYQRGQYTRAIQLFQAARRECEEVGDGYHQALCDLDQAEIFLELNLVEEAADLASAAISGFETLAMPYEKGKALTNHAIALGRQGRSDEALVGLEEAREIFAQEQNELWLALLDFYRAVVLCRDRRPAEAIRLAAGARRAFADSAFASRAAMCELLLAQLYLDLEDPAAARRACRDALGRLRDLDLPALFHRAYLLLGQAEEALDRRRAALDAYRRSQAQLERLRSQLQVDDLKLAFLKDKHVVYESLVWLILGGRTGQKSKIDAFELIEKSKSRSLADMLSFRAHALEPQRTRDGALAARVRELRRELSYFYRELDSQKMSGTSKDLAPLYEAARGKEDELLKSLRELQATDHELGALQSGQMIDLETFRSSLPTDAALVEYFIARGRIFACVVKQNSLEIVSLASARRIRDLHRLLQFQLSKARLGPEHTSRSARVSAAATKAHLHDLYKALIAPLEPHLDRSHLVLAPHGFLHYVPFHALFDGQRHLIDRFSISYTPSASVFHLCSRKSPCPENRSLVLGIADEQAPQIRDEARAVAGILPEATLFLDQAATESVLRHHAPGSRFVHLATHGLFRRDNPMFSAIQLGTSRLSLFDLYDLNLDAELVVLSGCGTGLNAVLGAEELVGLTRGLLFAGARSVLVTLWDVNDASTADFMGAFYRHLTAGAPAAQALRQTMLELRQDLPLPYHWAPFILVGQTGLTE